MRNSSPINEFMLRHNLSRERTYKEINEGRLRTFKVGNLRKVSDEAEIEWIDAAEKLASCRTVSARGVVR